MKCRIIHESSGRIRVRAVQYGMSLDQADILEYYLKSIQGVSDVKVYDRTCDAIIRYKCSRDEIINALADFSYEDNTSLVPEHTGRALSREYEDKIFVQIAGRVISKTVLPVPIRMAAAIVKNAKYIILRMIEESQKLKSNTEDKASHLADHLVPYSLIGTLLTYAITLNATRAISILMVDFSCALKLSMPLSVLSAIREAGQRNISVKGGVYMETVSEADTIVFDKTGTLTKATPTVVDVIPFGGHDATEMLRIAACLEEHYPHSMAKAVVEAAKKKAPHEDEKLHKIGFSKIVMMTGDNRRTANMVAEKLGLDEVYSEVMPEDKADFIRKEHAAGRKVIMIGDGVNDTPALSEADVGVAISEGAAIAREVADVTIGTNDLHSLITLRVLSELLMKRIHYNYRFIMGFNSGLIALGVLGILPPATSALLHNVSTIGISLKSMTNLLEDE